ncbi:Protein C13F10.5 [Aphelenchoides avenae]|nr:Protein C13F10.5 [Aphelenchus avenae]
MKNVQARLQEYRKTKQATKSTDEQDDTDEEQKPTSPVENQPSFIDSFAVDVLNFYPMRKWREFCEAHPLQGWTTTLCIWLAGQVMAVKVEFGLVYFLSSLFVALFLNLGVRKEGEVSAYSVFNPNCERLLGQMTGEHFERDVLRRAQ